jgi:2-phosphosulfolactate phosphatase
VSVQIGGNGEMRVDVFGRYQDVTIRDTDKKNVVIIDVFRTTSVIVTALENGARAIIPAETVEEAWELSRPFAEGDVLLAGERKAVPIAGFHLDNSPYSFTAEKVNGKTVVMTTSNGTGAVKACRRCNALYIASFLNLSAVAETLVRRERDVSIVCSGTLGTFSLEDGLCAGMIVSSMRNMRSMRRMKNLEVSDLGFALETLAEKESDISRTLRAGSLAYRYLIQEGYERDVEYCLRKDRSRLVPVLGADGCIRSG